MIITIKILPEVFGFDASGSGSGSGVNFSGNTGVLICSRTHFYPRSGNKTGGKCPVGKNNPAVPRDYF